MNTKLDALFLALACLAGLALPVSFHTLNSYASISEKNSGITQIQTDTIHLDFTCKPISAMVWCDVDDQNPEAIL